MISQRLLYDTLQSNNNKPQEFISLKIFVEVACYGVRSTRWGWQKAFEKKTKRTRELKRKQKFDEIENIKKQKLTLQKTIDSLWEGFENETLEADKNQDFGSISKAASLH